MTSSKDAIKKIFIVIPAFNAERTLQEVIDRIPRDFLKRDQIILVDDGSTDRTRDVGSKNGLIVIRHEKNRGYGGAQKTGFSFALHNGANIVVLLHSDGQYAPEDLPKIVSPILDSEYDVVVASRFLNANPRAQGMPLYKSLGNRALTSIENLFFQMKLSEFHSGYRAYSREVLLKAKFQLDSDDFVFDSEILLQMKLKKARIGEISTSTFYGDIRSYLSAFRYGFGILHLVMKYILFKANLQKNEQFL